MQNSRETRGEIAGVCVELKQRQCERSEAIHSCFVVRYGLLRCARNDDLKTLCRGCLKIESDAMASRSLHHKGPQGGGNEEFGAA
jgi:hypothetical protein